MSIDMYSPRVMLSALEQRHPPKTFLLDLLFKETNTALTETIDIDIEKGGQLIAPFVKPVSQGVVVDRIGYTTNSFKPPYIKMKRPIKPSDLIQTREVGQHIYMGNDTPAARAQRMLGKDIAELQDMIIRQEERMAAEGIDTGKVTVAGEGFDHEVDFQRNATHTATVATKWDNASSDPMADIRAWASLIEQDSGLIPDTLVIGGDGLEAFLKHADIQKFMDMIRVDVGEIRPSQLPSGAQYIGRLRLPSVFVDLYTYTATYKTTMSGAVNYYLPLKNAWMFNSKARCVRQYAAIHDVEYGDVSVKYWPKSWVEQDPSARWVMVQSAPLPCIVQTDAFVSAAVLS